MKTTLVTLLKIHKIKKIRDGGKQMQISVQLLSFMDNGGALLMSRAVKGKHNVRNHGGCDFD